MARERGPGVVASPSPGQRARARLRPSARPSRVAARRKAGPGRPVRLIRARLTACARGPSLGPTWGRSAAGAVGVRRAVGAGSPVVKTTERRRPEGDPRVGAREARRARVAPEAVKAETARMAGAARTTPSSSGDGSPAAARPYDAPSPRVLVGEGERATSIPTMARPEPAMETGEKRPHRIVAWPTFRGPGRATATAEKAVARRAAPRGRAETHP